MIVAWVAAIAVPLALSVIFLPGNLTTNGHVAGVVYLRAVRHGLTVPLPVG